MRRGLRKIEETRSEERAEERKRGLDWIIRSTGVDYPLCPRGTGTWTRISGT
jgi:hypothetical protein